jgi:translation initiation factor IF-3
MAAPVKVNRQIDSSTIRLISNEGENEGVMSKEKALILAQEAGLDLVQVSDSGNSFPVCKIIDYGKYKYQQSKKQKQKHAISVKEIRVSYNIAEHDLQFKEKKVIEFLQKHHKVKYSMFLKGRERSLKTQAINRFKRMLKVFQGFGDWKAINVDGDVISTMLFPKH